eukprot:11301696-Karenia_brevis.AAC.1
MAQAFTTMCAQLGQQGVTLKAHTQGQSQASGGGDSSEQTAGGGIKRDLSPAATPPEEPQSKDSKKS